MPFPQATPEPDIIVISDEERREDGGEAQGQGERPQIPPPTVTATTARAFADGHCRHQVTLVCVWEEEAGLSPTWQLEEEQPPADPNPPQRQRSPTPPAVVETAIPAPGVVPRGGTPTPDRRSSDKARLRKERLDGSSCHRLGPGRASAISVMPGGQADGRPGSCGRRGTAIG
ncbi:GH22319 [Drosophila grimshawi]|uniref:GH22319 n=1 Tax=Drosophila grimshawi TaxID=7222 RepID=B4JYX0_DROGR|nr:GH22319 [Drosophila grimshawi]